MGQARPTAASRLIYLDKIACDFLIFWLAGNLRSLAATDTRWLARPMILVALGPQASLLRAGEVMQGGCVRCGP